MKPNDLSIDEIFIGQEYTFDHTFQEEDVLHFAKISGDHNPLHIDKKYAEHTMFGKRLVHGLLIGSLCSRLVGMHLPGKRCLYVSQNFSFKNPLFIDEKVTVCGRVVKKSNSTGLVYLKIDILRDSDIIIRGDAVVKII
jgi:acyl dehydratase